MNMLSGIIVAAKARVAFEGVGSTSGAFANISQAELAISAMSHKAHVSPASRASWRRRDAPAANQAAVGRGLHAAASRELRQARQTVGGGREGEGLADAFAATELRPLLAGDRLDPAERLLDPLTDALADRVARVSRRAPVDRRRAPARVLRDVGRRAH